MISEGDADDHFLHFLLNRGYSSHSSPNRRRVRDRGPDVFCTHIESMGFSPVFHKQLNGFPVTESQVHFQRLR